MEWTNVTTSAPATSRQEELTQLDDAEYMLRLSEYASEAVLFFRRRAKGVSGDTPSMRSLSEAARQLVSSLRDAKSDASLSTGKMTVHQLTPAHVYRATISSSDRADVHALVASIEQVLKRSDQGVATAADFTAIATTLDYYNRELDLKAAQAISSA